MREAGYEFKMSRSGLNVSGCGLKKGEIDGSGLHMSGSGWEWMRVSGSGCEHVLV